MTELDASGVGDHPPSYMIFLVVFLFFITGLLGFLFCHLLKKKGYRCRTGDMDDDEQEEEKLGENTDDEDEENQDTVEQILKCIIENEANMEAFNEMLGSRNICVRHDPRLRKESIGGVPPHHHTVHSGADLTSCHLCAQVRSKKGRRQSRTPRSKLKPGEQTVFSVGRFRVTHTDKKPHGGGSPNPMVSSDQLDQSQDSEDQKEGGYNLRSMFKDVRPPTENANGVAPPVGKRRKSMTIFGLRRGSDPVGVRAVEGATREIKFSIQQPPVVPEEQVQTETRETTSERGTRPGSRPETDPSKSQRSASPRPEPKTAGYEKQTHASSPGPEGSAKHQPTPGTAAAPTAPSSLPHVGDQVLMEAFDPEPQQTSTPIFPMPGSLPGFSPAAPAASCSTADVPVIQTPPNPNPSSSSDLDPSFGASLALISLDSSSPSSFQMKSPSPGSSLKTSPIPSEAASSRGLTPSPKLPSGRAASVQSTIPSKTASPLQTHSPVLSPSPKLDTRSQSLAASPADQHLSLRSSPQLTLESGSVMSGMSMTQGDVVSSPQGERTTTAEVKRKGILKTPAVSPSEGSKGSALSSPSDQLSKDRLSSLPVSPSSPLSPSSPAGGRVSSVTIVKASPDSKREFSVSTMVEDERKDQVSPTAAGQGAEVSVSGTGPAETPRAETAAADREDMVEMEDIRDCKVTEEEEGERRTEEEEKEIVRTSD